jgi:hypothetical protein
VIQAGSAPAGQPLLFQAQTVSRGAVESFTLA